MLGDFDIKEILRLDRARRGDDLGIQRDERRGHVARMHRDALIDGAEDRVIAVVSRHGKAGRPALADAVEAVFRLAEIPAAVQLRDVAADRPHVADVRSRHAQSRLGQRRVFLVDRRVGGDIGQSGSGADLEHARFFLDEIETGNGLDVDHRRGVRGKNVVLQRPDQIGATGNNGCFAAGESGFGLRQGLRVCMIECFMSSP